MNIRERIQRFMQGRNGFDQFSRALSFAALIALILAVILQSAGAGIAGGVFWWVALALMAVCYWRMLSKNVTQRYRENVKYLNLHDTVKGFFRREFSHVKQLKFHRFFKCPGCGQCVRTPRGKGKIRVICPKCGTSFIRRS